MRIFRTSRIAFAALCIAVTHRAAENPASVVPLQAPRSGVTATRVEAFRTYCKTGDGTKAFVKIKADFDRDYLSFSFPAEPVTYGDPNPKLRTSEKADLWRDAQDVCGRVAAVAEAATLIWIVTSDVRYLDKAREVLLKSCAWHFEPDWKRGAVVGATDIFYNDEAHFRLWRKLPQVYDQIRDHLSAAEKKTVLDHFRVRGTRSERWLKNAGIEKMLRNSLEVDAESHPVRFMAMTGHAGLALWDDLPEAREWWRLAYVFYRDQFSPWGGSDGGWAEGTAYWRGTFEHAAFQDTLLSLSDPSAYSTPFWKNSPYFGVYNLQPYPHTTFGDAPNAGRVNLEPGVADYMEHMARVHQDGRLRAFAQLCESRTRPIDQGLGRLSRNYPTACEFLLRNFIASNFPIPAVVPLVNLPPYRFFKDVGWVSLHSALGSPDADIHVTFKSSPYGSFSHSHADQNAFVLNAFGESLAINSAYREYHNSPHHQDWTRQTKSKNALLLDGVGQKAQSKISTGKITRFETATRYAWTTGDATEAYRAAQPGSYVQRVTRDLVFIDGRYVVLRDSIELSKPGRPSWLLHAENPVSWDPAKSIALIRQPKAFLVAQVLSPSVTWNGSVTDKFPTPVDPKYAAAGTAAGKWTPQSHLTLEAGTAATHFVIYTLLWPGRVDRTDTISAVSGAHATLAADGSLRIHRPEGTTDELRISDASLTLR